MRESRRERVDAIRDRVSDDTRDLLMRFGRAGAMAGSTGGSGTSSASPITSLFQRLIGGR
jgi:hypothetical protein